MTGLILPSPGGLIFPPSLLMPAPRPSVFPGVLSKLVLRGSGGGGGPAATEITVADSATTYSSGVSSHTVNMPSTTSGQLLIAAISTNGGYVDLTIGGSTRTLTPPAGWTPLTFQSPGTIRHGCSIYVKTATGSEASTETWETKSSGTPTSTELGAAIVALDGASSSLGILGVEDWGTGSATSGTTLSAPSLYGSYTGVHQFRIYSGEGSSLSDGSGLLESPVYQSTTGQRVLMGLVTPDSDGGGRCGAYDITQGSSADWTAFTLLLLPEDPGADHASVLYRNDAGFTETGAINVVGTTTGAFSASDKVYLRLQVNAGTISGADRYMLAGYDGASTLCWAFEWGSTNLYLGADGNATGYWLRTNQLTAGADERMYLDIDLQEATASPARGAIRELDGTVAHPGTAWTVNSTDTTTAGAATFDRLKFYNVANGSGQNAAYSKILLTSESLYPG